jgi:2,4-didehydro-3-deoxy-L-rhamnonate hydrolase
MRICRFDDNRVGLVRGIYVHDITEVLQQLPQFRYPLPDHDPLIAALDELRPTMESLADRATPVPLSSVKLLAPVASPRKIVAAPVNYRKHLDEALADPAIHFDTNIAPIQKVGLFLKATSSLVGPSQDVVLRDPTRRNDHEIELVAVIGRQADRVSREEALAHVAGYAIGLDMTVRGTQERSMRKSIDTYTVLGPTLITADELDDPGELDLNLWVNGELRQSANTRDLVLDIADLIAWASSYYTLMPGDLLFTGTPEGVAEVKSGDRITAEISSIGTLEVSVR